MNVSYLIKLAASAVCGFLFGIERQKSNKDAGIRTNMLVCLAACTLVIVSKDGFVGLDADVSRVAASVIPGIGFLGAGSIFMRGNHVSGLTTSSVIRIDTAVGMAIGAGLYELAAGVTLVVCTIMYGTQLLENKKRAKMKKQTWEDKSV